MFFLLLIYMFISSVAGMQLLGQVLPHEQRARFDGFAISMLTIFQFLTGENWDSKLKLGTPPSIQCTVSSTLTRNSTNILVISYYDLGRYTLGLLHQLSHQQ